MMLLITRRRTGGVKLLLICVFVTVMGHMATAQKSPAKFGNIAIEDFQISTYDSDSSAAAFYLFDYGKSYINSGRLQRERHFRIKILKPAAFDLASLSIFLLKAGQQQEKVIALRAASYSLENGKVVESSMSKDGIFVQQFNRNIVIQKFTVPNVKVGSVIECSYTVSSDFFTNFPDWTFQHDIPVAHSEYWAIIPDNFVFEKYMQGYLKVTDYKVKSESSADFQFKSHHWTMKNVPAFKREPFMISTEDFISKVRFSLSQIVIEGRPVVNVAGTWEKLNQTLVEDDGFGGVILGSGFLKQKVTQLTSGIADPTQKVAVIYNYVKENIEWNGIQDLFPGNLKDVHEKGRGSSADVNFTFASMLEKAGIPVDLVILSTRDHGFLRTNFPSLEQFNYVICLVQAGGKTFLVDATERFLPMTTIPARCLNGDGLVISRTNHGWVRLETKVKGKTSVDADLALLTSGELNGTLSITHEGYDARKVREDFAAKGEKNYVAQFLEGKNWYLHKIGFEGMSEVGLPVKQLHNVTVADQVMNSEDVMYVNPFVVHQEKENPFSRETRLYPVDFGTAIEKTYVAKITLPDGYAVEELPESRILMLPGNAARFTCNITQNGNIVTVLSMLQINQSIFAQTEYAQLREFYAQIIAKHAEQIVVRKKK